ncbi:hypothetical protein [Flexibacterium corallicola]|uniref:hypothetical protein n=1 Tax=Flexibacterium corallicola TaxID=3037259 RepID=UPI00286F1CB6|nr:hypothetical protein [Pseudovibrio sp. M1P-2-3]
MRVTYSSELKELGFSHEEVAEAIGDKSVAMGKHFSHRAEARKFAERAIKTLSNKNSL